MPGTGYWRFAGLSAGRQSSYNFVEKAGEQYLEIKEIVFDTIDQQQAVFGMQDSFVKIIEKSAAGYGKSQRLQSGNSGRLGTGCENWLRM